MKISEACNCANLPESAGAIHQTAEQIKDGDVIVFESNAIKKNKTLTVTANIQSLGAVDFRHGKGIYGASSIVIDSKTVRCYNHTTEPTLAGSWVHGLTISGETNVVASVGAESTVSIRITANGKTFAKSGIKWIGTNGQIAMESIQTTMKDVVFSWDCSDYSHGVWLFGDSYFTYYEERWPYYIAKQYDNFLLSGFPGAMSTEMYPDFQQALTHGAPK